MICTSDFSGLMRGKGVPTAEFDRRCTTGIGWTPTNVQITCFDTISDSPYGALGDLVLRPDPETRIEAPLPDGRVMAFALGDIHDLDGSPWECCTRGMLKAAVAAFEAETGLRLKVSFEHEFMFDGPSTTAGFSLAGFAERLDYIAALTEALAAAGIAPDSFLREYGPNQMEVTLPPADPLRAADQAASLRDLARAVARAMGERVSFAPLLAPNIVGNGVHVHLSLWDAGGAPVTHDAAGPGGLSDRAGAFVAGLLRHADALCALTAPSAISYLRLVPHRWSAAFNNLGKQDREASVRICPVSATDPAARARQFNVEFRAADAAASPHLALAGLILAGLAGMRDGLAAPQPTEDDISEWDSDRLAAAGLKRIPGSLEAALAALEGDAVLGAALPDRLPAIYAAHKRGEITHVEGMAPDARFAAYGAVY
jgi:glutamine synthetase